MDSAISSSVKQCNAMASQSSTGVNLLLHPLLYQSHRFVLECIPVATFSLGRMLWKKLGHEFQAVERNISSFPVKPTLTAIPSFSGRNVLKSLALLSARKKKKVRMLENSQKPHCLNDTWSPYWGTGFLMMLGLRIASILAVFFLCYSMDK